MASTNMFLKRHESNDVTASKHRAPQSLLYIRSSFILEFNFNFTLIFHSYSSSYSSTFSGASKRDVVGQKWPP